MTDTEQGVSVYQQNHVANANNNDNVETEIDLMELLYQLLENMKYIIAAAILGMLIAGVCVYFFVKPTYEATAKLYVMSPSDSAINLSDLQVGSYLTNDYQEVFNTWEVHEMVITNLGLPYTYKEIRDKLTISNPKDTRILSVTFASHNPQEAATVANEYANVAIKYIASTMATEEPNIMSVALVPTKPSAPNKAQTVLIGFLLGALLSIGILTVRFVLDDKIKTADDIRKYADMATLAVVPTLGGTENAKRTGVNRGDNR